MYYRTEVVKGLIGQAEMDLKQLATTLTAITAEMDGADPNFIRGVLFGIAAFIGQRKAQVHNDSLRPAKTDELHE